jgi:hypothetical protein
MGLNVAKCRGSLMMNYQTFEEVKLQRHRDRVVTAEMTELKSEAQLVNNCLWWHFWGYAQRCMCAES